MNGCRCNERLITKTEGSKRLAYTGLQNFKIRRIIKYPEREEEGGGRERVQVKVIFQMNNKPAGFFFPPILTVLVLVSILAVLVLVSSLIYFYWQGWELVFSCGFSTLIGQFLFLVYFLSFCASFLLLWSLLSFFCWSKVLPQFLPASSWRRKKRSWKEKTKGVGYPTTFVVLLWKDRL
jgi:hypothetical protein